jgi:hypothetical protein
MSDLSERVNGELRVVDGVDLPEPYLSIYQPGRWVRDTEGRKKRLPRYFYEIPEREMAWSTQLAPHFALGELLRVDLKEADSLRDYPRYVPCAVRILATYLERFRDLCEAPVFVSVNGGYRSPAHRGNRGVSAHSWAAGADIYRIGASILDDQASIEKYGELARRLGPEVIVYGYGHEPGTADDHLHLDLGFLHMVPREMDDDERVATLPEPSAERRAAERRASAEQQ